MIEDQPSVVRAYRHSEADVPEGEWPTTVPAVAQLLEDGIEFSPGVTFLVGENGSGKSTVMEAIAEAYGFSAEGGTIHANHATYRSESPLAEWLGLQRGVGAPRWGYFLRAETMHSQFTYLEELGGPGPNFHAMSHGESFVEVLKTRFAKPGFYCLDEPESALSFQSSLALVSVLDQIAKEGGQVVCATHSPLIAALPGARILELGPWGIREATWEDLDLVQHWRSYLDSPQRYLRHLLDD